MARGIVGVVEPGNWQRRQQEVVIYLQPLERRPCQVIINVPHDLTPNQFVALEVVQMTVPQNQSQSNSKIIGSIGLIAFVYPTI